MEQEDNKTQKLKLTGMSNGELYDLYAPAIYGDILQSIPEVPVAEHVLAKVFLRAFQGREALGQSLRSPLSNLLIDSRKTSQRTLLALKIFSECCAGASVSINDDKIRNDGKSY